MVTWNKLFWPAGRDKKKYSAITDKIEFTGCNRAENNCLNYLPLLNKYFRESDKFYKKKDFVSATEALEKAFHLALELQEPGCLNCALFFQATILHSLESLHKNLDKLTKSIFADNRIKESFSKTDELLGRIKSRRIVKVPIPYNGKSLDLQPVYPI
jgi:hypothetical protein